MKILMISNHLGVQSGVQRYVQNLLLNLDLTRYQVDLFVGLCPPDQASCAPALEAAGVHIIAVPDNKKARIRALYQHLKTHKDYDIIHYHTASKIGAPVCGMMRVLCPHAKIIVHSHIVYPPMTLTWRAPIWCTSCLQITFWAAAWLRAGLCLVTISTAGRTFPLPAMRWTKPAFTPTPRRARQSAPSTALPEPSVWPGL